VSRLRAWPRVNLALKPGGRWINFGSLAFSRAAHAERLSLEEVSAYMPKAGFAGFEWREASIPYMRSPASRHARIESTISWVANKVGPPAETPRARVLPDWLLQPDKPVPRSPAFEMQAISSRVHAFLLALITVSAPCDMARVLGGQRRCRAGSRSAVRLSSRACTSRAKSRNRGLPPFATIHRKIARALPDGSRSRCVMNLESKTVSSF
jgi:hypothetical protein